MAQRFDPHRLEVAGDPVRVPVMDRRDLWHLLPALSASANGGWRIAAREPTGVTCVSPETERSLANRGRIGRAEHPRMSPDGRSLALIVARDLWRYDLDGRPPVKLTFDGALSPVWSRDGQRIVYEGGGTLRAVPADGSGKPEDVAPKGHFHPHSFTPTPVRLWLFSLWREGPARSSRCRCNRTRPSSNRSGRIFRSALARWPVAGLHGRDDRRTEIWVRPYPGPGAPIRVSPNGGSEPVWARNGREMYYLQDKFMMAVAIDTAKGFNFKPAIRLFETSHLRTQSTSLLRCHGGWPLRRAHATGERSRADHGDPELGGDTAVRRT